MKRRNIQNVRFLITGASSGIGRQLALLVARNGAKLVLNARRESLLEELREQILAENGPETQVELVPGDVTSPEVREALISRCTEVFGGLDVLVNNAGAAASGLFEGNSSDRLQKVLNLNFVAPVELIRLAIPLLKQSKAHGGKWSMIVNLSSIVGIRGVTHYSEYCGAKAAIRAFSESIRTELHRYGIEVLVVSPGSTDTGFFTDYIENTGEPAWPHHNRVTPQYVAKEILKAIQKGKHEIIPFFLGRVMHRMNFFFPNVLERVMVKYEEK